jgi:glycosyltransferase involved in cell wall biosynthesis
MTPDPIRILRLITRLNAGGPARHVVWLSAGLRGKGYETRLVSGDLAPGESDLSSFAAEQGVVLDRISGLSREIDVRGDLRVIPVLVSLIRSFNPHIVHTHTAKAGFVGRLAARLANVGRPPGSHIRVVHTFHGNVLSGYFHPVKEGAFRLLERGLARRATDAVVVLSPQQREELVERFRVAPAEKTFVVPLALDLSPYTQLPERGRFRREMGFADDAFVVGIVGRLAPIKNHEMFLRAAGKTLRAVPDARFVVIGDGESAPRLRALAESLGLAKAVRFAGLRTDLAQVYADLDAVALTSQNEGTPLSLIEAMACGCPVVATDVGGVADVLTREWTGDIAARRFATSSAPRGLLVPSGDEDGFARALERLAGDRSLGRSLGNAGRVYAFTGHALPRLFDDLDSLYRHLLAT